MDKITLNIITPTNEITISDINKLNIVTDKGSREILPFHTTYLTNIEISVIEITKDNRIEHYALGGGLLHFFNEDNKASLVVSSFILLSEAELKKSDKALEIALNKLRLSKERMRNRQNEIDIKKSLSQALNNFSSKSK